MRLITIISVVFIVLAASVSTALTIADRGKVNPPPQSSAEDSRSSGGLKGVKDPKTGSVTVSGDSGWYTLIGSGDTRAFTLHAYDSTGRHTGPVVNHDFLSDLRQFEQQIPNSSFEQFDDEYVLTLDADDKYQIELHGVSTGNFNLEVIFGLSGDSSALKFLFSGGRIQSNSKASMTVSPGAAIPSRLIIDLNGDGKPDTYLHPVNTE